MPKVSTSKNQRQSSDYTPSSRKGDSGGKAVGREQKGRAIPFGSGESGAGELHDSPVAWPVLGGSTKYNKSTNMPIVKTTVVGHGFKP